MWLIDWRPGTYSQTITSSTWFCFHCNTFSRQGLNIHFLLINSQFIPLPIPISLPFIMHYAPFFKRFSSNHLISFGILIWLTLLAQLIRWHVLKCILSRWQQDTEHFTSSKSTQAPNSAQPLGSIQCEQIKMTKQPRSSTGLCFIFV